MSEQLSNLYGAIVSSTPVTTLVPTVTLAAPYTAGSGSISVSSATGAPTSGTFSVTILNAQTGAVYLIFRVSSVSGTTFSGAAEGTDANAPLGAAVVGTILTAEAISQIKADAFPTTAVTPGSYTSTNLTVNSHGQITAASNGSGGSAVFDLLSEARIGSGGTFANSRVKAATIAASASEILLNYTGGDPGYIADIWIALSFSDTASFSSGNITITIDGEGTPAINVRLPLFFCAEYLANGGAASNYNGRFVNGTQGGGQVSVCFRLPIPFSSSAEIVVTNGSSSQSMTIWYEVNYMTDVPNTWPSTQKLWCASGTLTNQPVNAVDVLVNASSLNPGRFLGAYLSIDSTPNSANPPTGPLEGAVQIYFDGAGSPQYQSSGTEDYFHSGFYFQNVVGGTCMDYVGYPFIGNTGNTWNCYRWHILDLLLFTNAIKFVWNCGNSAFVNFTGGVRLAYCVWYYTEI